MDFAGVYVLYLVLTWTGSTLADPARHSLGVQAEYNKDKSLLEDYNFVVIAPSPGKIEKIIITSLKQPPDKRYVSPYVVTTHVGAQHRVQAVITGPNNQDLDVELVVDTGSSTVVLPASEYATRLSA